MAYSRPQIRRSLATLPNICRTGVTSILLLVVALSALLPLQAAWAAPPPPFAVASYYISTIDPTTLFNQGCALGQRDRDLPGAQDNLVILAFGAPRGRNGSFGTLLFSNTFAASSQIATAVEAFARGYATCTGEDRASHLRIAIGTSNFGSQVTFSHGRAWAQLVTTVSQRIAAAGHASQVDVVGASDMEPDWNGPATTRAWVDGYASAFTQPLYNFGTAAGCPPFGSCGTSAHPEWTQEDIWYISWGAAPARPLPQIYLADGGNAQQWYQMSLYALTRHQRRMEFVGVLTQHQACQQVGCHPAVANSPQEGWSQFWDLLNSDSRTAQDLRWSADISWQTVGPPTPDLQANGAGTARLSGSLTDVGPVEGNFNYAFSSAVRGGATLGALNLDLTPVADLVVTEVDQLFLETDGATISGLGFLHPRNQPPSFVRTVRFRAHFQANHPGGVGDTFAIGFYDAVTGQKYGELGGPLIAGANTLR
ncbi:MAG: hypothetical protein HY689_06770 [Chloroflexi bacterium]|nr:hypothetical protein [Chloroflexota bacterium]